MKTLQQIQDEYAKEKGYGSWEELVEYEEYEVLENAFNVVIQIVQDELKKKVSDVAVDKFLERHINWGDLEKSILNTENIK